MVQVILSQRFQIAARVYGLSPCRVEGEWHGGGFWIGTKVGGFGDGYAIRGFERLLTEVRCGKIRENAYFYAS